MIMAQVKDETFEVSFTITLKRFSNPYEDMPASEMKENIKYWLELQFDSYYKKFKIKNLKCKKTNGIQTR